MGFTEEDRKFFQAYSAEFGQGGAKSAALKRSSGRREHKQEQQDVRAELALKTKALEEALAELETYKHREVQQVKNVKKLEIMLDKANVEKDGLKAEVATLTAKHQEVLPILQKAFTAEQEHADLIEERDIKLKSLELEKSSLLERLEATQKKANNSHQANEEMTRNMNWLRCFFVEYFEKMDQLHLAMLMATSFAENLTNEQMIPLLKSIHKNKSALLSEEDRKNHTLYALKQVELNCHHLCEQMKDIRVVICEGLSQLPRLDTTTIAPQAKQFDNHKAKGMFWLRPMMPIMVHPKAFTWLSFLHFSHFKFDNYIDNLIKKHRSEIKRQKESLGYRSSDYPGERKSLTESTNGRIFVTQFDDFVKDNLQFNVQDLGFAPTASLRNAVDIALHNLELGQSLSAGSIPGHSGTITQAQGSIPEHSGTINHDQHTSQIPRGKKRLTLGGPFPTEFLPVKTTTDSGNPTKRAAEKLTNALTPIPKGQHGTISKRAKISPAT